MPIVTWLTAPQLARTHLLYPWLTEHGSLTAAICAQAKHFRVQRLRQTLSLPLIDEAQVLGLTMGTRAWLREVLLVANEVPVVYARSWIRQDDMRGAWHLFSKVGQRPLGHALFSDPRIERGKLYYQCFDARDVRFRQAMQEGNIQQSPTDLWARRCLFRRQQQELLVSEFFLPSILKLGQ